MPQQPMLDIREGEIFLKTSVEIKTAIRSQIHDNLQAELNRFMTEVQGELEGINHVQAAGLFLAVMMNSHLQPKALLTRSCLDKAVHCQNEINELTFICNNLQPEENFLYKLSLDQVKRYGMAPKTGEKS